MVQNKLALTVMTEKLGDNLKTRLIESIWIILVFHTHSDEVTFFSNIGLH